MIYSHIKAIQNTVSLRFWNELRLRIVPGSILTKCTFIFTIYCFFFSITRVKYDSLKFQQRRVCGVVVRPRVWLVSRSSSIRIAFSYILFL